MAQIPPEARQALSIASGDEPLDGWFAWLAEHTHPQYGFRPRPAQSFYRGGYLVLTRMKLAFLAKAQFGGSFRQILSLDLREIDEVRWVAEDLFINRMRFRIREIDLGQIAGEIQQALPSSPSHPQAPMPTASGAQPVAPPLSAGTLPDPGSDPINWGDSAQMMSCPECNELIQADQKRCPKCGADLSSLE